jgi:hypothetical protein
MPIPEGTEQPTIELYGFSHDGPLGRYGHMRNAIDLIWNSYQPGTFIWNSWSEWMVAAFCEERWVTVSGPAASWKTTSVAIYLLCAWFSAPRDTVVVCTSTTLDGLRRRIWKEISRFYRLRPCIGNVVQSRNCIQYVKGLDDAGIFGLATDKGEIDKAIGKIIGFHAPQVVIAVDEMPYTPEAIVEAAVNLESGARRFQFIGLGNADDHLDPHGRMCEPLNGWDSVSEESEQWETRRGICIHLDGLKSPAIVDRKEYPGLINQKDLDTTAEIYGLDSPQFWQMRRGFWAPEGIQKTVLTMPMIIKAKAQEQAVFDRDAALGAALDPAFEGGDRCVLRFFKCGLHEGRKILGLQEIFFVKTKASPADPVHYQIVRQVREECVKRAVPPRMFALDATGEGGGLLSIFQREWSPEVLGIEFGGRPSRQPVSQTNPKRCDQEYDRRVTELWFFFRLLVQGEQVKGLDQESAREFCRRHYEMKGAYISIETKAKMKERTRMSPDLADNIVIGAELFRQRGALRLEKVLYEDEVTTGWSEFQRNRSLESVYEASPY